MSALIDVSLIGDPAMAVQPFIKEYINFNRFNLNTNSSNQNSSDIIKEGQVGGTNSTNPKWWDLYTETDTCVYVMDLNLTESSAQKAQALALGLNYTVYLSLGRSAFLWAPEFLPSYRVAQIDLPKFHKLPRFSGLAHRQYALTRVMYNIWKASSCEINWVIDKNVHINNVDQFGAIIKYYEKRQNKDIDLLTTIIEELDESPWNKHAYEAPWYYTDSHIFRFSRKYIDKIFFWSTHIGSRFTTYKNLFVTFAHHENLTYEILDHEYLSHNYEEAQLG
eukprot:UN32602